MPDPIRILHVLGGLSLGGAESRIMDLYRKIDRTQIQFDFLIHQKDGFIHQKDGFEEGRIPEFYDEEIKSMGGRIYILPKFKVFNYFSYKRAVRYFFAKHHEYSVVQGHMTSTASIYLPIAKKMGIKTTAAHARSAGVDAGVKGRITKWLRKPLLARADYCFACSKEAGKAVFGKYWEGSPKSFVIPNAIDADKFAYREEVRNELRKALKLSDCYVMGHVGRFHYAKNHEFLLRVFGDFRERMKKRGVRAVLLLLGDGAGMNAVKEQAKGLGVLEDVLFMGNKGDVEHYYQSMDFFVFPSRYEGLPGTVVEAQASGLKCIISDTVTEEVALSELVHFESIDSDPAIWARYVEDHAYYERRNIGELIENSGFDIKEQTAGMQEFYRTGKIQERNRPQ